GATISMYLVIAVLFAFQRSEGELVLAGASALLISAFLMQKDFVAAFCFSILVYPIGPIFKFVLPVVGMVNLGDVYLVMIVLTSLSRRFEQPIYFGPFRAVNVLLLACLILSVPFLPDIQTAVPGYISLLQLAALYIVILNEIRTDQDIERI